jgi:hypothetical protein
LKTNIRWCAALASTALLAWHAAHAADPAPAIVGRWEAVARSHGGIGQVVEFQTEGTMVQWIAAMVDGTYTFDGTRLVESMRGGGTAPPTDVTVETRFEGSELIQRDPRSGAETRMTRQGAPSPQGPSLVGVWSFTHDAGGTAYMMFTADGRMIFRLPIRADRGRWSVAGDRLTMGLRSPGASFKVELQGDRLTLTDDQGKQRQYVRAELAAYK